MNIFDQVYDFLKEQGLMPNKIEDNRYIVFKYQTYTFVYMSPEDDEYYFKMCLPGIFDVTEDNRDAVLEIANDLNTQYKLVKVCVEEDRVDINVEFFLDSDPVFEDFIPRVLGAMLGAFADFHKALQ